MSAVSRLQKDLLEVEQCLQQYQLAQSPDQDEEVLAASRSLEGDLRTRCDSMRHKLEEKDPVTGNSRFGPTTSAKVKNILALYEHLTSIISPLIQVAANRERNIVHEEDNKNTAHDEMSAAERIKQHRVDAQHPAPPAMVPLSVFRPNVVTDTSTLDGRNNEQNQQENEAARDLRERADEVRSRKRSQAESEAQARHQEKVWMEAVANSLNIRRKQTDPLINDSQSPSKTKSSSTHLYESLKALQLAARDIEIQQIKEYGMAIECEAEALQMALTCVKSIMTNIISHPDDDKLRRIRINHPIIKERLTKLGVASVQLLVALGFRARVVTALGNPIPDEELDLNVEENTTYSRIHEALTASDMEREMQKALTADGSRSTCRLTLLLVLSEPPTETTLGREAWKVWFDGLHSSLDIIKAFESEVNDLS